MGVGPCGRHGHGTRCRAARCGLPRSIRRSIGSATVGLVTLLAAVPACAVDELPLVCPDIARGELVITELRGNIGNVVGTTSSSTGDGTSTGSDTATSDGPEAADLGRDWIEIRSLTDRTLDLYGLALRNADQDGGGEIAMVVRYHRELDPGDAYVLGLTFDYERPLHIDYGLGDAKGTDNLLDPGRLELASCDTLLDVVVYDDLPADGTWSLGIDPPDPDMNDDEDAWCSDTTFTAIGDAIEPGTPGEPNRPCD